MRYELADYERAAIKPMLLNKALGVPRRYPAALLDPVEEAIDEIAGSLEVRTEADRLVAIAFRRDVGPCSLVNGKFSDPVGVIATIGKQHRSRLQARQFAGKPIVVGLTGRQREPDGQAIGINHRMNFARQPAP
jgi:hypothetical protein